MHKSNMWILWIEGKQIFSQKTFRNLLEIELFVDEQLEIKQNQQNTLMSVYLTW